MTILRRDSVPETEGISSYPGPYNLGRGKLFYRHLTLAGGLSQFGAALERLEPGGQSSQPHWHEREDEFLFMLDGTLTVVEDGEETEIGPGDACCWPAGDTTAHTLKNTGDAPALYLIVGSRDPDEICHYPGRDMIATPEGYTHLDGTPWTVEAKES